MQQEFLLRHLHPSWVLRRLDPLLRRPQPPQLGLTLADLEVPIQVLRDPPLRPCLDPDPAGTRRFVVPVAVRDERDGAWVGTGPWLLAPLVVPAGVPGWVQVASQDASLVLFVSLSLSPNLSPSTCLSSLSPCVYAFYFLFSPFGGRGFSPPLSPSVCLCLFLFLCLQSTRRVPVGSSRSRPLLVLGTGPGSGGQMTTEGFESVTQDGILQYDFYDQTPSSRT